MRHITLFCSSTIGANSEYILAAEELGTLLAKHKIALVYGAADTGLMKATADKVIENGGNTIGFTTKLLSLKHKVPNSITHITIVETLQERKAKMMEIADGFIILPGGFGTFDELFEVIAAAQLNIHNKPIIIINTNGFYNFLKLQIETMLTEEMLLKEHASKIHFVNSSEQAVLFLINLGSSKYE